MRYWSAATDKRFPWCQPAVMAEVRDWFEETMYADFLHEHGERVLPLLLAGETRCGKTSIACEVARSFDLPAYRMQVSECIGKYMGDTTKNILEALHECIAGPAAIWIMDEVDGIFGRRSDDTQSVAKEWNAAMASALAMIENLPPHVSLVATTNLIENIDPAMVSRFRAVRFPAWKELSQDEARAFAKSHGVVEVVLRAGSYADVVKMARSARVKELIKQAKKGDVDK